MPTATGPEARGPKPEARRSLTVTVPFELHIAWRYLLAKRKQAFISLISMISMIGVAVGVTALVIALALMTGLQGELRDRILGSSAHVYVWKQGGIGDYHAEAARLRGVSGVTGAAPAILGKALLRTARGDAFITFKGVDPELEPAVTDVGRRLERGSMRELEPGPGDGPPGILIGVDLASQVGAALGDDVTLTTPEGTLSPMGLIPRSRRFRVVGLFRLGLYEFDSAYGFVALETAASMLGKSQPDLLELRVADIYRAAAVADRITEELGGRYVAQDWSDMNRSLFSALWLEKMAISITIGLIVMVAALNIIASLVLLVMEKSRDIAILKTMGASARSIMTVFMLQGLIIGLVGTTAGSALGYALATVLDRYRLIQVPNDVYQVSHVPFTVLPWDFGVVVVSAILICFVATLYPSRQAARLDPVQALRFE
jgi:lipoprotein-releasing system permease protein